MQILGDLIKLPDTTSLPLPWWHRAPLGLLNGTRVFVALVDSGRPVGELIVTVLDPNKWENMLRLQCKRQDQPGVLLDLLDSVYPLNIALAESVTLDARNLHQATLICESLGDHRVNDFLPRVRQKLHEKGFDDLELHSFMDTAPLPVRKNELAIVQEGWLRGLDYRQWIANQYSQSQIDKVHLDKVVVSADTERRLLRFMFPLRGAKTIKIQHADKPGTLLALCRALAEDCELNVLSALLRRGGQKEGDAELVAVCEPLTPERAKFVQNDVEKHIYRIPQDLRPVLRVNSGRPSHELVTLRDRTKWSQSSIQPLFLWADTPSSDETYKELEEKLCSKLANLGFNLFAHCGDLLDLEAYPHIWRAPGIIILSLRRADHSLQLMEVVRGVGILQALAKPILMLTDSTDLANFCRNNEIAVASPDCDTQGSLEDLLQSVEATVTSWTSGSPSA